MLKSQPNIKSIVMFLTVCVVAVSSVFSEVDIKFNGDLWYILRYETIHDSTKNSNLSHNYIWNFKAKAIVSEDFQMGFRISNPAGYASNQIVDNFGTFGIKTTPNNDRIISIPEMYFKWTPGKFKLAAGIIPVNANITLDLVAWEANKYINLCKCGWFAVMNNSQTGINMGFDFIKNEETSFGIDVIWAIATEAGVKEASDAFKHDNHRLIASLPLSIAKKLLVFTPTFHFRTNVYRSKDEANHSASGGLDIGINPAKFISLKTGIAVGGYKSDCMDSDTSVKKTDPMGMLVGFGTKIMPGFGKIMFDFKYSSWEDREKKSKTNSIHTDLKYAMPLINKNLTIMPRIRVWHYMPDVEPKNSTTHVRYEIFTIGKF